MSFMKLFSNIMKKSGANDLDNCVQRSLKNGLLIAQLFGLMPLSGIAEQKIEFLRFKWISFRTAYALFNIAGGLLFTFLQIIRMLRYGSSLREYRLLVFYMGGVSSAINFLLLARKWPMIMRKWQLLESSFSEFGMPTNLNRTINSILTIYLTTAFRE